MALGRRSRGGNAGRPSRGRAAVAALAVGGIVAASVTGDTDPVDAQDPFVPAELASFEPSGSPLFTDADNLSMSALGHVVSYEYAPGEEPSPLMRVRTDPSVAVPDPTTGRHHGLSDDGCVIAYQAPPINFGSGSVYPLIRFNRCTGGTSTLLQTYDRRILGSAAVDADGSVIAFPAVGGIAVYTLSGNTVTNARTIPAPNAGQGWSVSEVAISDDGSTLAVIAGAGPNQFGGLDFEELHIVDVASGSNQGIASTADSVSMSGDGSLVAYRNYELGQILVLDRTAGQNRPVSPGSDAFLSNDGRHLAVRISPTDSSFVFVLTSIDRWAGIRSNEYISYPFPNATGFITAFDPVLSEHGRWAGWISPNPALYVNQPPEISRFTQDQALVRERRPVLTVQSIDYGTVPGPTDRTSTVTNIGPSGWRVTAIESTGPFQVRSENCPAVLHPGASCQVTVRFLAQTQGQSTGELRVRDTSYPGIPLVASGRLVGSFDPGSPVVTTTTVPGVVTTTTQPGTPPDVGLSITPNPVVFDSTVVGQPATTRTATVTNVGDLAITVQSIGIAGVATADFDVVDDGCTDEALAPGASCTLEIGFTPTAGGARSAAVSASGTSGTFAAASLRGTGRYDVELEVSPEVAAGGQVVTVTGTGYPASSTVQVSLAGSAPQSATTDANGRFDLQWLVLEGTPQGTVQADDVATTDYDADPVDLQIVPSPMRPQGNFATLDRAIRNHVSR